jgi:hypothetical protein
MQSKLERDLKLVIPLESGALVYSSPVSKGVYEANYLALAKVYSTIMGQNMLLTGPAIAARMLRELGKEQDIDAESFIGELRRLCLVAIPSGEKGYAQEPLENAIRRNSIDEDDVDELENFLVFSTAASFLSTKKQAAWVLGLTRGQRGAVTTPLSFTAYLDSLQTSITEGNSGEKAT